MNSYSFPPNGVRVTEVVIVECQRGEGELRRDVLQVYSKDGQLLAEHDAIHEDPVYASYHLRRQLGERMHSSSPVSSENAGAAFRLPGWQGLDLQAGIAASAFGVVPAELQDAAVLSDIEARLAEEVRQLIAALSQFSGRAQLIGKEIPDGADFCKLVTRFLGLLGFQLAHALGKGLNKPIFFDDGAEYLRELHLGLSDFVREINLDGRRFLAVALLDEVSCQVGGSGDGGDKC
ncbi:hypothetical protein [Comamonas sp. 23]|uniref:hypothetical protein n=1 Tax=Comamonas sp. 23 TaxID=3415008 RepID=UPI003C6EE146